MRIPLRAIQRTAISVLLPSLGSCGSGGDARDSAPLPVCGDGGAGFVGLIRGGQLPVGVLQELGHVFVAIDPGCRFVEFESNGEPLVNWVDFDRPVGEQP